MSYRRFALLAFSPLLFACSEQAPPSAATAPVPAAPIESLVSVDWLAEHLADADLVVLDATVMIEADGNGGMRPVSGRANYEAGHIKGARFADLMGELSDAEQAIGFAVPAPEAFAAAMARLGVGDNTRVVLYSANNPSWAARVWWMLRWIGFDNAALLDGGLKAWTDSGRPLSAEMPLVARGELTVKLRPELIVNQDQVRAAIENQSATIIDALPESHYRGETAMYARPGHIKGAVNVPVFDLYTENGEFRSLDEQRTLFDTAAGDRMITYCGGGIAASAEAFVLTRLGYDNVAVYTASLQEWTADPENPMETSTAAGE
ncbi:MAG: sulfurtransferase [Woeseia sp.]